MFFDVRIWHEGEESCSNILLTTSSALVPILVLSPRLLCAVYSLCQAWWVKRPHLRSVPFPAIQLGRIRGIVRRVIGVLGHS